MENPEFTRVFTIPSSRFLKQGSDNCSCNISFIYSTLIDIQIFSIFNIQPYSEFILVIDILPSITDEFQLVVYCSFFLSVKLLAMTLTISCRSFTIKVLKSGNEQVNVRRWDNREDSIKTAGIKNKDLSNNTLS